MRIILAPNPLLREKSKPVAASEITDLRTIAEQMAELMYENQNQEYNDRIYNC